MLRLIFCFSLLVSTAFAMPAPNNCDEHFFLKKMPNTATTDKTYQICFTKFATLNSSVTKTPLWSAEHLTQDRIKSAKTLIRKNTFHPEPLLPVQDRASLTDYLSNGYDRGHMSPDADMPDALSMHESFSLANMVPQHPCNNEIIWKNIEISVREYVLSVGEVYVLTGPIFGDDKTIGPNKVKVPTKIFKAVYDPTKNTVIVLTTLNSNVTNYETITLEQLKILTGIEAFPMVREPSLMVLPSLHKMNGICKKSIGIYIKIGSG